METTLEGLVPSSIPGQEEEMDLEAKPNKLDKAFLHPYYHRHVFFTR